MKGIIFTEFLELVETLFGLDTVDHILGQDDLASGGAYTAVGTYDYTELLKLVTVLSQKTSVPVPALVHAFGKHLFNQFIVAYPHIVENIATTAEFVSKVESLIHVEVRKLYPDARLPTLTFQPLDEKRAAVSYKSARPFADLAVGLIEACAEHFGEDVKVERTDTTGQPNEAQFLLTFANGLVPCPAPMS